MQDGKYDFGEGVHFSQLSDFVEYYRKNPPVTDAGVVLILRRVGPLYVIPFR